MNLRWLGLFYLLPFLIMEHIPWPVLEPWCQHCKEHGKQQALIGKYAMGAPLVVKSMALFPVIHTSKDHIHLCGL